MGQQIRFLSASDVVRALPMTDAIEGMKSAYAQLSSGQVDLPLRSHVQVGSGVMLTMPAYLKQSQALAVKVVSIYPENLKQSLPTIHALVMVMDAATGRPLAVMQGGTLTAIRTGAGSGAATDILARPDCEVVAVIGSGVQARTQLEAICTVRPIKKVLVYSPNKEHAAAFAQSMTGKSMIPSEIEVVDDANQAVEQADIICTATTSTTPVFSGTALKPGTHINGVGSFRPDMQELDVMTIQKSLVVVDSRAAVLEEAGELIIPLRDGTIQPEHIYAELGEIINGAKPGRTSPDQITFFKSVGLGVQDAVAGSIAVRNAQDQNLGTLLDLLGQ